MHSRLEVEIDGTEPGMSTSPLLYILKILMKLHNAACPSSDSSMEAVLVVWILPMTPPHDDHAGCVIAAWLLFTLCILCFLLYATGIPVDHLKAIYLDLQFYWRVAFVGHPMYSTYLDTTVCCGNNKQL